MTRKGTVRTALAVVASLAISAAAQEEAPAVTPPDEAQPSADLPSAEELFARHLEAIGGEEVFEKIQSREITGRVRNQQQNFLARLHIWAVAPNKMRTDVDAPGMVSSSTVFDGEAGWRTADGQNSLIIGNALIDLAMTSDFFGEANYKERYERIETIDKAIFNEKEVYRVKCQANTGKLSVGLFDVETGLIVGAQTTITTGGQNVPTLLVLDDYQDFGGMLWPTSIIQRTENGDTFITYRKITVNEVDESVFERPAEVEDLIVELKEGPPSEESGG